MDLAIVAGRVSTKDQADRGYSLPEQVATGLAYVQERGYQLTDVPGFSNVTGLPAQPGTFVEDYTGMSMDRPALDAIRDVIKPHGVKVIVFTETDRLARKRIYGDLLELEFEELGARVEYAIEKFDDSDEGRLFKGIKKELAEYERLKILRRMRTGQAGRVKGGKVLISDRAPYGYRKSADGAALVICDDEAEIVRFIFERYIDGLSARAIAARLNEQHVPTYAGKVSCTALRGWSASSVRTVLAAETYTGTWHFNKSRSERKNGKYIKKSVRPRAEWIGVAVPAIIDAETFAQTRARAEHNKASASRNRKRLYLFSGMLKCDACGWSYSGSTIHERAGYRCSGMMEHDQHGARLCRAPYYSEADLDAAIWPWLTGILSEPGQAIKAAQAKAEQQQGQTDRLSERLARIETTLADIRRRIASLDDLLETETDDENRSALRERKAQHTKARRELEAEHAAITAQQERSPWACRNVERFLAWCEQTARRAEPETPEQHRETYELANLAVRLEVKDGLKLAHVTCMVGEQTLEVGSIANVAARGRTPTPTSATACTPTISTAMAGFCRCGGPTPTALGKSPTETRG